METLLNTRLEAVRTLIISLANTNSKIGEIEESLKWGQQSFATIRPKSGTPIRMAGDVEQGTYSLYVPCSTSIISNFRDTHPEMFDYHGNREIRFELNKPIPETELSMFISQALTYYLP